MPIFSTLLLVGSLLGDTATVIQPMVSDTAGGEIIDSGFADTAISLPELPPSTIGGEPTSERDSTGSTGFGAASSSPGAATPIPATPPPPYISHLYLTAGGINFESTESDVIDFIGEDEDDQEEKEKEFFSVMLEENPKSSGLGILIPGTIVTTIGGIIFGVMLSGIDGTVSSAQIDRLSGIIVAGSLMTISGTLMVTAGIPQFKSYLRWSNRYRLPQPRRSTVSRDKEKRPAVIRKSE